MTVGLLFKNGTLIIDLFYVEVYQKTYLYSYCIIYLFKINLKEYAMLVFIIYYAKPKWPNPVNLSACVSVLVQMEVDFKF